MKTKENDCWGFAKEPNFFRDRKKLLQKNISDQLRGSQFSYEANGIFSVQMKNFHSPSPSPTPGKFQDFSSIFPHFPLCNSGILYYIFPSIHHTKNFYVPM
jgi:hypothetical protein